MDSLLTYLKFQKSKIDTDLKTFLNQRAEIANKIDPILDEIISPSVDLFLNGGKRLRPILVNLGYELSGGSNEGSIVRASLFAELMHSYILVHDDIADRDNLRYGKPTLQIQFENDFQKKFNKTNKHFGLSIGIIAGDLIQTLAHQALISSGFSFQKIVLAEELINSTLQQVVAGWYIHQIQNHQKLSEASIDRYLTGMKLVSASYTIESPLLLGNLLADSPIKDTKILEEYAFHTGMAFQIQDDILGVFGDPQVTGKPAGNDLREGKKTLLILKAYKNASDSEKIFLEENLGAELDKDTFENLKEIIINSGSLEYSRQQAEDHIKNAKACLTKLPHGLNQSSVEILSQIADFVLSRNS